MYAEARVTQSVHANLIVRVSVSVCEFQWREIILNYLQTNYML